MLQRVNSFLPVMRTPGAAVDAIAQPGKELIVNRSLPIRSLLERPDLDQLRRQAKELFEAYLAGDEAAVAEVNHFYLGAEAPEFALHQAQLVLARSYGFDSWPTEGIR